jgi:cobalamin biosynthesis Mg chelatase CobN
MLKIKYDTVIHVIISAAIGLLILFLFTHCNTVHKSTQSLKQITASVHVVKSETAAVSKKDSAGTKSEAGNYEKETVYQYDTVYQIIKGDTVLKYIPRIVKVYEKGAYQKQETATQSNYDSTGHKASDSVKLTAKTEVKNTDKKSSRLPIGLIIGVVALLAVVFVVVYLVRKIKG